jgi:outer membrane biosynthesis protein TonB
VSTVSLRAALIWHDEVMDDVVLEKPKKVTVGTTGRATFVIPNLGLPANFAIIRPGNRGYLLTLGENMRGTICVDGQEQDVSEFVRGGGEFHATPINGKDWGVVELDESGDYKLFFQFVPVQDAQPFFTKPVILAGIGGYLLSTLTLALIFWARDVTTDYVVFDSPLLGEFAECLARGALISACALGLSAIVASIAKQESESQASLAFSVILHAAFIFGFYFVFPYDEDQFVWPGPRSLAANYLVTRLEPETKPPDPPKPVATGKENKEEAAAKQPEKKVVKTATKNDEGAAGGKGETERARDPNAKDVPPAPPKVALMEDRNRKILDNILERDLATNLGKFTGIKGDTLTKGSMGFGPGHGTGVGDGTGTGTTRGSKGKGSGGGGNVEGDFVTNKGPISMGKDRPGGNCTGPNCHGAGPKEVAVSIGEMTGDPGGLTKEEIDRVVRSRAGVFRACYQKELNRSPGIGGKMVIHFVISGDGTVKSANGAGGSLKNEAVESCVTNNIMRLHFPAKPPGGIVNYPFVFSPGG